MSDGAGRTLVVGTDGSEHSVAAFDWAVQEAMVRGGHIRVLAAWHRDPRYPTPGGADEAAMRTALETVQAIPHAAVDVSVEVGEGVASAVLVEAAAAADLLVVGSLGMEAGRRVVLGSVSARCALLAGCPVVIVPAGWRSRSAEECCECTGSRP